MTNKNKIIKIAIKLFNAYGTKAITTNHIAKEAKISPGNLYYHFKNKIDIIRLILDNFNSDLDSIFNIQLDTISDFSKNIISLYNHFFQIQKSYQFLFIEGVYLIKQDKILLDNYAIFRTKIKKEYQFFLTDLVNIKILKKNTLNIINDLLETQWIILWYWINHSILDRKIYDDFQIKKGIKLSFSIIEPHLTPLGKVEFDKTLKVL